MGVVYEAIDRRLGRAVALKLVYGGRGVGDSLLLDEARAMASVRHPAVLTVYEAGELDGSVYLAMELIRGATLRQHCERTHPTRKEIIALYRRAAAGLEAAHAHGLVHRDFKPDNVLIEREPELRVMVADFGLATVCNRDAAGSELAGTPAYMAPEQLDAGPLDERVDVFAFCVSLWEALLGTRPFAGRTLAELREAIDVPLRVPRELPRRIGELLVRGLAAEPAARPTMSDIIATLRPKANRRLAIAAGAVVALLSVIATIGWVREPSYNDDLAASCAAMPTPGQITLNWQHAIAGTGVPAWVRTRVATRLAARDREVVALQHQVCTTGDNEARRAWMSCRRDHAIDEAELVRALSTPWPSYDHLETALDLPWPSMCTAPAARLDAVREPTEPAARADLDDAKRALIRAVYAAIGGKPWHVQPDRTGVLEPERLLEEAAYGDELTTQARLGLLERAVERAEREGHVTTAARAWLALAVARGAAKVDGASIDLAYAQASWSIDRVGNPPMLRSRWHAASVGRAWQLSDLAAVERHARATEALAGDDPDRRALALRVLADAAAARADFTAERALLEARLPEMKNAKDVAGARFFTTYAECLYHLGENELASREIDHAIELARTYEGERDPATAEALLVRGSIELDREDLPAVTRTVDAALDILYQTVGRDHLSVGMALNLRTSAHAAARQWKDALADSEAAEALFEAKLGPRAEEAIFARTQIGQTAEMLGDRKRARRELSRALGDARITYGPDDTRTADIEIMLADLEVGDHHNAEARALLEHAVVVQERAKLDPPYLAQAQADLAKVLDDRPRAIALARAALASWHGLPAWKSQSEALTTWLKSHLRA
ncbi:MAG: Protein kinase [Myxococcales bacterium]|nr:Protein kinase [Myxococcales bacterium]